MAENGVPRRPDRDNGGDGDIPRFVQHDALPTGFSADMHLFAPWRLPFGVRASPATQDGTFIHALLMYVGCPMRVVRSTESRVSLEPLRVDEDVVAAMKWAEFSVACTRLTEPRIQAPTSLELTWKASQFMSSTHVFEDVDIPNIGGQMRPYRYSSRYPPAVGTVCDVRVRWYGLDFDSGTPTPRMIAGQFCVYSNRHP